MQKKLAFVGCRPERLPFGEDERTASAIRLKALLLNEIMQRVEEGYDTFLTGAMRGGDILFAEQLLLDSVYMRLSQNSQPNSDTPDMNSRKER